MKKNISFVTYLSLSSMLFGLFFGAGNLIFPVQMGQEAGANIGFATLGFLVTGVGLPFLGILAMGISQSDGLRKLASRVHPVYGIIFTIALYLAIGPLFALPRTASVSFEIGFTPSLPKNTHSLALFLFTCAFFLAAWFFSLKPSKILTWVGKVLNPLFLIFLSFLIIQAFRQPLGTVSEATVQPSYVMNPFFKGFIGGYNTMDALASLAFGMIIIEAIKDLGVKSPKEIAKITFKTGILMLILMSAIYACLAYMGTLSLGKFPLAANGGITLDHLAYHYFGSAGRLLLALIVTFACLKTAIGLTVACSETFHSFYDKLSYKTYVTIFSLLGLAVANIGLNQIIALSLPVLMCLYPLAIVLILLTFMAPLFHNQSLVYQWTIGITFLFSLLGSIKALPSSIQKQPMMVDFIDWINHVIPLESIGMGWLLPAIIAFIGAFIYQQTKQHTLLKEKETKA